jgi:serine protease Do
VKKQQVGSGSGFIVSADGLIVTNKHVVSDDEATYTVVQSGGKEFEAKVLGKDPNNDIAILKIEGENFPVLPLGDSDAIKVGQTAIAIGNPLGEFANSVSRGIVSGIKRDVTAGSGFGQEERLTNIIQTDAAINPGNSGGPLFDIKGRVIGINVAVAQGAENIGFALPINDVKRIITQVRETGRIVTPYIGVRYALLNEKAAKTLNLPYNYGALILRGQNITDFAVIPGSPADKAGIIENDIILEINSKKIDDQNSLSKILSQFDINQELTLLVWSKGETKEIKLILEEKK